MPNRTAVSSCLGWQDGAFENAPRRSVIPGRLDGWCRSSLHTVSAGTNAERKGGAARCRPPSLTMARLIGTNARMIANAAVLAGGT